VQLSDESIVTSSFDGTIKVWGDDYNLVFSSSTLTTSYNDVVEITAHKLASETLMIAAANDDGSIKVFVKFAGQPWGVRFTNLTSSSTKSYPALRKVAPSTSTTMPNRTCCSTIPSATAEPSKSLI
jgi:hypothetical protein